MFLCEDLLALFFYCLSILQFYMYKFTVRGVVQGVGFRPYIYNACVKAGLKGYAQNIGDGVIVEVSDKEKFIEILKNVPPLARVDSFEIKETKGKFTNFVIKQSKGSGFAEVPPDLFLCSDCLSELKDSGNRRHNYFFTTCTNCGPRFSMTKKSPYDRKTTSMKEFKMCSECETEYTDPKNRRYHAQTIACHNCGPKLSFYKKGNLVTGKTQNELIEFTAQLIQRGEIVAIKGVGGFHLACGISSKATKKLRVITGRPNKPFAVMCRDLKMVKSIGEPGKKQMQLLESTARPIVLVKKTNPLTGVTELDTVGVMLPYTALHFLIFDYLSEPIVMTSSNFSDEPISTKREQQITDYVLDHNRVIENAVDDSVMSVVAGKQFFLRRSRGFVPRSIPINAGSRQVLALGAEMNNSFCVYKDGKAILSQFLGDTSNEAAFAHYIKTLNKFLEFTKTKPDVVLADLHPEYNTSRFAESIASRYGAELKRVQHHAAHGFSVAAENNLNEFSAIVCDGLGFGADGTLWGGEVFDESKRIGHLEEQFQLGGDSAAIFPGKMLFSVLRKFLSFKETRELVQNFKENELSVLEKQLSEQFNCIETTSCGRILDSASVLLGFCQERTYDGRPAMLLEANSSTPLELKPVVEKNILKTTPLFEFLVANLDKDKRKLAATVQQYLAEGLYSIAEKTKKQAVFSGGCAYNKIMSEFLIGKGVLVNEKVPSGDGGISFGQLAFHSADSRNNIA